MQRRLRDIAKKFPDRVARELFLYAEADIMTPSKREYVPVDLEGLRSSGFVDLPSRQGTMIEVAMFYGGASAPYALAIHEHPGPHDPPSWQGATGSGRSGGFSGAVRFNIGGPKYLELPMMAKVPTMARDIAKRIQLDKTAR
jgi:hypothetical protein